MLKGLLAFCLLVVVLGTKPGPWDAYWDNLCVKGTLATEAEIGRQFRLVATWTHPDRGYPGGWFVNATKARDVMLNCRERNLHCGRVIAYEPAVWCQSPKEEAQPKEEPKAQPQPIVTLCVMVTLVGRCGWWWYCNPTPPYYGHPKQLDTNKVLNDLVDDVGLWLCEGDSAEKGESAENPIVIG